MLHQEQKPHAAMKVDANHQYRSTSLVSNRKIKRPNGAGGPNRTKTYLYTHNCCHFSFIVKWDIYGFYVQLEFKTGASTHQHYPKIDKTFELLFPRRLLTQDQIDPTKAVI